MCERASEKGRRGDQRLPEARGQAGSPGLITPLLGVSGWSCLNITEAAEGLGLITPVKATPLTPALPPSACGLSGVPRHIHTEKERERERKRESESGEGW